MTRRGFSVCAASLLLAACGGGQDDGGGGDSPYRVASLAAPTTNDVSPTLNVPASAAGTFCVPGTGAEVFGGMQFFTVHPFQQKAYGCLVVDSANGHPVLTGSRSIRFELGPNDCSAGAGYDDCANDSSRNQIEDDDARLTNGRVLTYDTNVYIPAQTRFRPAGCCQLMALAQLNFTGDGNFGVLAYLGVSPGGGLFVRTHQGFSYNILNDVPVAANPVGRWINVRYEIKSTTQADGYLKVSVDGVLMVDQTRATLPSATAVNRASFGIYNAFKSRATEPYATQVFYMDGISKTVQ